MTVNEAVDWTHIVLYRV